MKKYLLLLVLFFTFAAYAADNGKWTGYISDSHCGAPEIMRGMLPAPKNVLAKDINPYS